MFSNFLETTKTTIVSPTTNLPDTSPSGKLDSRDYGKVFAHVLIGSALAGLAIAVNYVDQLDLGVWTSLAVPALMGVYQLAIKWLKAHDTGA